MDLEDIFKAIVPLTFLTIRLSLVACILAVVAFAMRAPWPRRWTDVGHITVAGLLVHGVYLGGVFTGIAHGLPAGVAGRGARPGARRLPRRQRRTRPRGARAVRDGGTTLVVRVAYRVFRPARDAPARAG